MHYDPDRLAVPCKNRSTVRTTGSPCVAAQQTRSSLHPRLLRYEAAKNSFLASRPHHGTSQSCFKSGPTFSRHRSRCKAGPTSCFLRYPTKVWHPTNPRRGTIRPLRQAGGTGKAWCKPRQAPIATSAKPQHPSRPSGSQSCTGRSQRKPNAFRHKGRRSGACRTFTSWDTIALARDTGALSLDAQARSRHGVRRVRRGLSYEEPHSQLQSTPTAPPLRPPTVRKAEATAYVANPPPSVRPDPPPETPHPSRAMGQTISISIFKKLSG